MTLAQTSIFDFKPLPIAKRGPSARWMMEFQEKAHAKVCRTDAEAMAESLGGIPTKGTRLRCMVIDPKAPYNQWCKEWESQIWWHNSDSVRFEKLVDGDGRVKDVIYPWPHSMSFDKATHKYRDLPRLDVLGIRIEKDVLIFETTDGEWMAEICDDSRIRRYDFHPYRPSYDLEHFAIECYRHKVPKAMMEWRSHYVWATEGLSPFWHTSDHPAVYKEDRMGRVPWAIVPNEQYSQICECARLCGVTLELSHDVPPLDNLAMWPIERTCATCLRKGCSNWKDSQCWKNKGVGGCYDGWMWDRKSPAKGLKRTKATKCECDEDEGDDCE